MAVLGLARSGLACAEVLTALGAHVRLYDSKPADALLPAIAQARKLGIEPVVGGAPVAYDGLDYLITSPGVPKRAPVLTEAVARGVPVIGEIEAAYRIARAPILAITGTNGKTTTTVLLGEMLRAAGFETYIGGNVAAGEIAMPLITAAYLAGPDAAIVAEISSFQLEWIDTFRPKVAALLNITPDHADRQTWDEYVAAKWRIFENQTAEDFAVLSNDFLQWPQRGGVKSFIWEYGCDESDEFMVYSFGENIIVDAQELEYELCKLSEIKLPGKHNVENIMAAAAMATAFGVGVEPIRQVATTFTGVVHRLEYVATLDGVRYINNSMCTNVVAFEKSLAALPEPKVVIAGGVFKGDIGELSAIAQSVQDSNVRSLVLIGRSAVQMEAAARDAGYQSVHHAAGLAEAVGLARTLAKPGDTVLLAPACASFDMFRDFEDRGDQFKAAVRRLAETP